MKAIHSLSSIWGYGFLNKKQELNKYSSGADNKGKNIGVLVEFGDTKNINDITQETISFFTDIIVQKLRGENNQTR